MTLATPILGLSQIDDRSQGATQFRFIQVQVPELQVGGLSWQGRHGAR